MKIEQALTCAMSTYINAYGGLLHPLHPLHLRILRLYRLNPLAKTPSPNPSPSQCCSYVSQAGMQSKRQAQVAIQSREHDCYLEYEAVTFRIKNRLARRVLLFDVEAEWRLIILKSEQLLPTWTAPCLQDLISEQAFNAQSSLTCTSQSDFLKWKERQALYGICAWHISRH